VDDSIRDAAHCLVLSSRPVCVRSSQFPLLVALAYGARVARSGPSLPTRVPPAATLALTLTASAIFSSTISSTPTASAQLQAFYTLPSRFWQVTWHDLT
jgi:hypothetical protein